MGMVVVSEWISELKRTDDNFVLEGEGGGHKHKVEHEHRHPQQLRHLPAGDEDADEDEEQHGEEEDDGAAQPRAVHRHRREPADEGVEEPGQRQPARGYRASSVTFFQIADSVSNFMPAGQRKKSDKDR